MFYLKKDSCLEDLNLFLQITDKDLSSISYMINLTKILNIYETISIQNINQILPFNISIKEYLFKNIIKQLLTEITIKFDLEEKDDFVDFFMESLTIENNEILKYFIANCLYDLNKIEIDKNEIVNKFFNDLKEYFIKEYYENIILEKFNSVKLYNNRMISGSKSRYRENHMYEKVYFNANIFINIFGEYRKVWYGDLNINEDGNLLKEVSSYIGLELFVLDEMSGRFGNEKTQAVNEKNVWKTSQDVPVVTKKDIKRLNKEKEEKKKLNQKIAAEERKKTIEENHKLPVISVRSFLNSAVERIPVPYEYIEKKIKKGFEADSYVTADLIWKYLNKTLNPKKDKKLDISAFWINEETNKILKKIDLKYEQEKNLMFKEKDFKRDVTCNLCLIRTETCTESGFNEESFKTGVIYILTDRLNRN